MKQDPLKQGREEYLERLRNGEIERSPQKNPIEKWEENKKSLRASVSAFCFECIGEIKADIRDCTAYDCKLYHVRQAAEDILSAPTQEAPATVSSSY